MLQRIYPSEWVIAGEEAPFTCSMTNLLVCCLCQLISLCIHLHKAQEDVASSNIPWGLVRPHCQNLR